MNTFNRMFGSLIALAWGGVLAGCLLLVWDQNRAFSIDTIYLKSTFDIFAASRAEQILESIVIGALMLPAVILLGAEMLVHGGRRMEGRQEQRALEQRVAIMQKQLEDERQRADKADRVAADKEHALKRHEDRHDEPSRRWRFLPGAHH